MRQSITRWQDICRRGTIASLLRAGVPSKTNPQQHVEVNAWIRSIRRQKHLTFISLIDGSSSTGLQAVVKNATLDESNSAQAQEASTSSNIFNTGASIALRGQLVTKGSANSKGKGRDADDVELQVESLQLIGACDSTTYPIQKKDHSTPFLRRNAHLRGRTSTIADMLRLRDAMTRSAYGYFAKEGYIHAHMPVMTSSDCEGAGEVFSVAHGPKDQPHFSTPTYLSVSGQLHLEAVVVGGGLGRAWHLGPAFRAESSDTNRHLNEFWMLEAEVAFTESLEDVLSVTEGLIRYIAQGVVEASSVLAAPSLEADNISQSPRWKRLTYAQALKQLQDAEATADFKHRPTWSGGLKSEHERWLAEQFGPTFVTNYPVSQKPFYMRLNDEQGTEAQANGLSSFADADEPTVACFDLLIPRIGELVGGSLREERLDRLMEAMKTKGLNAEQYEWYLDLRRYGSVPHGGFGLGWERLVSWLSGSENVRECIAFPRGSEGSRF